MTTRRSRIGILAVAALALVACGGDDKGASPRPLTDHEASLLANALFDNYEAGGASFQLAIQFAPGTTINLQGQIDWTAHRGTRWSSARARRRASRRCSGTTAAWSSGATGSAPCSPRLADQASASSAGPSTLKAATSTRRWHSSPDSRVEQHDNPLLIKQTEGSGFLRADELQGVPADVLRYGPLTTYWLASDDGRMLRFEGNNTPGTRPVVIELLSFGSQAIEPPPSDQIVDASEIQELYDGVVSAPPSG